jgi:hypothetical protein
VEPTDGVLVEPVDGTLNSEGSALLHFTRSAQISATVRVNCKVVPLGIYNIEISTFNHAYSFNASM